MLKKLLDQGWFIAPLNEYLTGSTPYYKCVKCPRVFRHRGKLKKHMMDEHGLDLKDTIHTDHRGYMLKLLSQKISRNIEIFEHAKKNKENTTGEFKWTKEYMLHMVTAESTVLDDIPVFVSLGEKYGVWSARQLWEKNIRNLWSDQCAVTVWPNLKLFPPPDFRTDVEQSALRFKNTAWNIDGKRHNKLALVLKYHLAIENVQTEPNGGMTYFSEKNARRFLEYVIRNSEDNSSAVEVLIEKFPWIVSMSRDEAVGNHHWPILTATITESPNTVKYLVDMGADISVLDIYGRNPMHIIVRKVLLRDNERITNYILKTLVNGVNFKQALMQKNRNTPPMTPSKLLLLNIKGWQWQQVSHQTKRYLKFLWLFEQHGGPKLLPGKYVIDLLDGSSGQAYNYSPMYIYWLNLTGKIYEQPRYTRNILLPGEKNLPRGDFFRGKGTESDGRQIVHKFTPFEKEEYLKNEQEFTRAERRRNNKQLFLRL